MQIICIIAVLVITLWSGHDDNNQSIDVLLNG